MQFAGDHPRPSMINTSFSHPKIGYTRRKQSTEVAKGSNSSNSRSIPPGTLEHLVAAIWKGEVVSPWQMMSAVRFVLFEPILTMADMAVCSMLGCNPRQKSPVKAITLVKFRAEVTFPNGNCSTIAPNRCRHTGWGSHRIRIVHAHLVAAAEAFVSWRWPTTTIPPTTHPSTIPPFTKSGARKAIPLGSLRRLFSSRLHNQSWHHSQCPPSEDKNCKGQHQKYSQREDGSPETAPLVECPAGRPPYLRFVGRLHQP